MLLLLQPGFPSYNHSSCANPTLLLTRCQAMLHYLKRLVMACSIAIGVPVVACVQDAYI